MITGVHTIVFADDADAARAFFRDVLGLGSVDAGGGWLIFALPPGELALHPGAAGEHRLSLMCDDLEATMAELAGRGAEFAGPVTEERWGRLVPLCVPGAGEVVLYQPTHRSPITPPDRAG